MTLCESEIYQFSFLVSKYKESGNWVLYNWANTKNISIDDNLHPLYIILESEKENFYPFNVDNDYSDFNYLLENKFIVKNQNETIQFVEEQYKTTNRSTKLDLILMPVNQACNFDCIYCYEDHSQKDRMGVYDQKIIEKFIQKYHLTELGIDYFGGEPLLNYKFILEFNQSMIDYSNKNSIEFTSSMTTNGYLLTQDLFVKLLEKKVTNYQISIDGIEEDHDKLRPLANGKGSFSRIYNNLIEISKLPKNYSFMIIIRINFNELTAKEEKQNLFLVELKNKLGNDKRFVINPHVIVNWKREKDNTLYPSYKQGIDIENLYRNNVKSFSLNPFNMVNFSGIESNSCYADKKNTYVIFPSSSSENKKDLPVQKCTIGIFDEANTIGYLSDDGDIFLNKNAEKWIGNSPFKKQECKSCFFVLNCYGSSCPLNTIRTGFVKCPSEKYKEVDIVKEIMQFISET